MTVAVIVIRPDKLKFWSIGVQFHDGKEAVQASLYLWGFKADRDSGFKSLQGSLTYRKLISTVASAAQITIFGLKFLFVQSQIPLWQLSGWQVCIT